MLCWRLGFKWTITRNSIIMSYISLTNLRRKVGIWFPPGREVDQLWRTELPFKQWFPIDRPSGSESVRRMCSVRIMWHQSFCFNHNTCWGCNLHCSTAGIQTPAPQTKTTVSPLISDMSAPFTTSKTFIKNAGVNISNNSQSPSLSTSAKNLEAKGNGRISLSKLCACSHREGKRGKLQPDL